MTWVAAEAAGNPIKGFDAGTRVEYTLTNGDVVAGRLVVPGTDKIGSAHGIELDSDPVGSELHWIGTGFVRPEGASQAPEPTTPRARRLTPVMERAMDQLTGTTSGKIHRGQGVAVRTARALADRGLVYLEEDGKNWTMVLIEPEVQEITDADLENLVEEEARVLRPLTPKDRYRALRHAHIARETWGKGVLAINYGDASQSRAAVLANRVGAVLAWKRGEMSDRQYSQHRDLAGEQWKAAREYVTDTWSVAERSGRHAFSVEAATREDAIAEAARIISADQVGYAELLKGYGTRRMNLGDVVAERRELAARGE